MKHPSVKSSFISLVIFAIVLALIAFPVAVTAAPAYESDVGFDRTAVSPPCADSVAIAASEFYTESDSISFGKISLAPAYDDMLAAAGNPYIGTNYMSGLLEPQPASGMEVMRVGVMSAWPIV